MQGGTVGRRLPPYGISRCPVSFRFARNSLPRILEAVDDFFHLNGALKAGYLGVLFRHAMLPVTECLQDSKMVQEVLKASSRFDSQTDEALFLSCQGPARATHRRGSLGGNEIVFSKHDMRSNMWSNTLLKRFKECHSAVGCIPGDAVNFDQFWFKLANVVHTSGT